MKSAASKSDESQVVIYTAFNPPPQEWLEPGGPSMTQQQFAEECDVNNILANYIRTGDISLSLRVRVFMVMFLTILLILRLQCRSFWMLKTVLMSFLLRFVSGLTMTPRNS